MRRWFKDHLAKRIDEVIQEEACPRTDLTVEGWALLYVIAESGLVRANPNEVHYADRGEGDGKIDVFYQTEDLESGATHFHILQVHAPDTQKIRLGASRGSMTAGKLYDDALQLHKRLTGLGKQRKLTGLNPTAAYIYDKLTQEIEAARTEQAPPPRVFNVYPVCLKRAGHEITEKLLELRDKAASWSHDIPGVQWKIHDIYTAEQLRENIARNQNTAQPTHIRIRIEHGYAGEADKPGRPFLCFGFIKEILDCYEQYGAGLFDGNLRYYLGRRTVVNSGIYQELQSPTGISRFNRKNNGLTIACDHAKPLKKDGTGKQTSGFELSRPQIINGGQTLVTLHGSYQQLATNRAGLSNEDRRRLAAIESMTLPMKIVQERDPKTVDEIAVASNTQNPISSRTLRSSTRLMREARVTFAHGSPPWYLETKDGEWSAIKEKPDVFQSLTNGKRYQNFSIDGTKRYRRIDNTDLGVAIMAFYGYAQLAKKSRIFDAEYFEHVFDRHVAGDGWEELAGRPPAWGDQAARDRIFSAGAPSAATAALAYHVHRFWSDLTYAEGRQREMAWEAEGEAFRKKWYSDGEREWNVPSETHSALLTDKTCVYHREHYARAGYLALSYQTMRLLVRRYGMLTDTRCAHILALPQFLDLHSGGDPAEFRNQDLSKEKTPLWTIARIILWGIEKLAWARHDELAALGSPQQALLNPDWMLSISQSTDDAVKDLRQAKSRLMAKMVLEGVDGDATLADLLPELPSER